MEIENEQKSVNIAPISKGKRILVFLADFFLMFIFTFVTFNVLTMPLANIITNSSARQSRSDSAAVTQFDILYGEKVLLYEADQSYHYTENVEFTLNCYLSYYSFEDSDVLETHPQYGHKIENEVARHFYFDIRNRGDEYISILQKYNEEYPYFIIEGNDISLKEDIKHNLKLSFFSIDDMSADGETQVGNLKNIFLNIYAEIFKDIEKNDLMHGELSYLHFKEIVTQAELGLQWQLVIATIIAYMISLIIYFVVIPLFNKDNRTLAMMMMRMTRIGTNNLFTLNKIETILIAVQMTAFCLPLTLFMPMTYVTFTYLFKIPVLPALFFVGLLVIVSSLVTMLISPMNRTIGDYLSRSVVIKNDDLDAIYRSKGYDI